MKDAFKLTAFILAFLCFSCSNESDEKVGSEGSQPVPEIPATNQIEQTVKYQCPMKCEGDKTCEEPLDCPVCNQGMEIIVEAKKKR